MSSPQRMTREEIVQYIRSLDVTAREELLRNILRVREDFNLVKPSQVIPEKRADEREKMRERASAGALLEGTNQSNLSARSFNVRELTAENNPELFRQVVEMSGRLNARYGTNLPPPQVLISDNPQQIPIYNVAGDVVIISAASVRAGHAPAFIAHELGERISQEKFGDSQLHFEIHMRRELGLTIPDPLIEAHRRNECREDADAIFLVGPEAVSRALGKVFNDLAQIEQRRDPELGAPGADALTYYMNLESFGGSLSHYPRSADRLKMAELMKDNPDLLTQLERGQMQFNGRCSVIGPPPAVRAAGQGTTEPAPAVPPR